MTRVLNHDVVNLCIVNCQYTYWIEHFGGSCSTILILASDSADLVSLVTLTLNTYVSLIAIFMVLKVMEPSGVFISPGPCLKHPPLSVGGDTSSISHLAYGYEEVRGLGKLSLSFLHFHSNESNVFMKHKKLQENIKCSSGAHLSLVSCWVNYPKRSHDTYFNFLNCDIKTHTHTNNNCNKITLMKRGTLY